MTLTTDAPTELTHYDRLIDGAFTPARSGRTYTWIDPLGILTRARSRPSRWWRQIPRGGF
jgi:hypothetical protein